MELLLKSSQVFSCRKMVYTPHHVATVWAQPFCYYGNNVTCHSSTCFTCELYVLALFSPLLTPPPSSHLPPPHTYPLLTPPSSSPLPLHTWNKTKVLLHCSMVLTGNLYASTVKHRCLGAHSSTISVLV